MTKRVRGPEKFLVPTRNGRRLMAPRPFGYTRGVRGDRRVFFRGPLTFRKMPSNRSSAKEGGRLVGDAQRASIFALAQI